MQRFKNVCSVAGVWNHRLALYRDELRRDGWSDDEIRAIETAVVRLLGAISDSDLPTLSE